MAKILTITLNPAIDVTVELDQLVLGSVNRYKNLEIHAAGKGLNVAQVLRDLGHQVIVSGFLGKENSSIFEQHFQNMHFDNQFIYINDATRQNIKIADGSSGIMTDINGQGFYIDTEAKTSLLNILNQVSQYIDFVIISGSLPQGFENSDLKMMIELFKNKGKKVAVDTSGQALVTAISSDPWMIKPNIDELEDSYGKPVNELIDQISLFTQLKSNIQHIVISMGDQGVNWIENLGKDAQFMQSLPPSIHVKSTVGAGDSLLAGMIHGIASGFDHEETLRTATAIASHAVSQIGFRTPEPEKLKTLKQHTTFKTLSLSDASPS